MYPGGIFPAHEQSTNKIIEYYIDSVEFFMFISTDRILISVEICFQRFFQFSQNLSKCLFFIQLDIDCEQKSINKRLFIGRSSSNKIISSDFDFHLF